MGLGWYLWHNGNIGHGGNLAGYSSMMRIDINAGVIILRNNGSDPGDTSPSIDQLAQNLLRAIKEGTN